MSERCECRDGCQCADAPGPAALLIMRDGAPLRVCTRCVIESSGDRVVCSIVPLDPPSKELFEYDFLGWLMLVSNRYPSEDDVGGEA